MSETAARQPPGAAGHSAPVLRYGSACSGIEAASVAWSALGWRPAFFSEIEPFPRAVLAERWPGVPIHGDFTTIEAGDYEPIDLLVCGTPCQDFSVAGLRAGLAGERGFLTIEFVRLAERLRPRWLVWENVPGVLSSDDGRAFGLFLGALGECGYGTAWRVLDAQHFGVPQRRRRVFVVGYLGDWRPPAAVLFEQASLRGDPAPRRAEGQRVADHLTRGANQYSEFCGEPVGGLEIAAALRGNPWSNHAGEDGTGRGLVTHALNVSGRGGDVTEDGTGRGVPLTLAIRGRGDTCDLEYREDGIANAILTPNGGRAGVGVGAVAVPILEVGKRTNGDGYRDGDGLGKDGDPMFTLQAGAQHAIAYGIRSDAARDGEAKTPSPDAEGRVRLRDPGFNVYEDLSPTLDQAPHAVAFHENQRAEVTTSDTAGALKVGGGKPGQGYPAVAYGISSDCIDRSGEGDGSAGERAGLGIVADASPSIRARPNNGVAQAMSVRRLLPVECEKLQGFWPGYTTITYRKKPAADGPRYRALGNSMAVPCMKWIGERIAMVEELL